MHVLLYRGDVVWGGGGGGGGGGVVWCPNGLAILTEACTQVCLSIAAGVNSRHKTPPQEGWTPTPTLHTLHHWQCAS